MRNKKAVMAVSLISIILVCCTSHKSLTSSNTNATNKPHKPTLVPDSMDVAVARSHWSGTTLSNLTSGYTIYSDKCVQCHETKEPQDFSVSDWNNILPGMGRRAHLDSNQYKLVYRYILAKRETMLAGNK